MAVVRCRHIAGTRCVAVWAVTVDRTVAVAVRAVTIAVRTIGAVAVRPRAVVGADAGAALYGCAAVFGGMARLSAEAGSGSACVVSASPKRAAARNGTGFIGCSQSVGKTPSGSLNGWPASLRKQTLGNRIQAA